MQSRRKKYFASQVVADTGEETLIEEQCTKLPSSVFLRLQQF